MRDANGGSAAVDDAELKSNLVLRHFATVVDFHGNWIGVGTDEADDGGDRGDCCKLVHLEDTLSSAPPFLRAGSTACSGEGSSSIQERICHRFDLVEGANGV